MKTERRIELLWWIPGRGLAMGGKTWKRTWPADLEGLGHCYALQARLRRRGRAYYSSVVTHFSDI